MSDPPDIESLARRYLDLWQQNISAAAADPDTARALAQFFGQFKGLGVMPGEAVPNTPGQSDDILSALASIDRRLAAIESRLDSLERPKRKTPAKPKSGKSGKT